MTRPIQLSMSAELDRARANLAMEIEKARSSPVLAKAQVEWCSLKWDLSDLTERSSPTFKKSIAHIRPIKLQKLYSTAWADLLRV